MTTVSFCFKRFKKDAIIFISRKTKLLASIARWELIYGSKNHPGAQSHCTEVCATEIWMTTLRKIN
jgi:hypothetical protein